MSMIENFAERINKIQEQIQNVTQQITFFEKNLEGAKQQLQMLQGHLGECAHWKQFLETESQTTGGDAKNDQEVHSESN